MDRIDGVSPLPIATGSGPVAERFSSEYLTHYAPLLGGSLQMRAVRSVIEQVADTNATVLLRGESGVGKDLVGRAIHAASLRHERQFIKVNCAALPAGLLESELFGHEKGAFTGAYRRKLGKFEFADGGTLFLDEIGELPLALQAKLLHVLQDFQFSRVGGRALIHVDVRVVASTNRDLELALSTGQFREDLYYRLNVVEVSVPALRERREEVIGLTRMFLARFNQEYGRAVGLSAETLETLLGYSWPGNVRELENTIRRLVVLANAGKAPEDILARLRVAAGRQLEPRPETRATSVPAELGLREIARRAALEAERRALVEVLDRVRWNRTEAARILKVSYKTLLTKIGECGLNSDNRNGEKPIRPR